MKLVRGIVSASVIGLCLISTQFAEAVTVKEWSEAKLLGLTRNDVHKVLGTPDAPGDLDGYSISDSDQFQMAMVVYETDKAHAVMLVAKPSLSYKEVRDLQLKSDEVKFVAENDKGIVFSFRTPEPNGPRFLTVSPPEEKETGPMIVESYTNPLEDGEKPGVPASETSGSKPDKPSDGDKLQLAEQGNAEAQFAVGMMFFNGEGVPVDLEKAAQWLMKAAEQGNSEAMKRIGSMYLSGKGFPKNLQEATKWFLKAAEGGNVSAMVTTGIAFRDGNGVPANPQEALKWFLKAADGGSLSCLRFAGEMYRDGEGVPQDVVRAYQYFSIAAEEDQEVVSLRQAVEKSMTPAQIQNGKNLLREWRESHF